MVRKANSEHTAPLLWWRRVKFACDKQHSSREARRRRREKNFSDSVLMGRIWRHSNRVTRQFLPTNITMGNFAPFENKFVAYRRLRRVYRWCHVGFVGWEILWSKTTFKARQITKEFFCLSSRGMELKMFESKHLDLGFLMNTTE